MHPDDLPLRDFGTAARYPLCAATTIHMQIFKTLRKIHISCAPWNHGGRGGGSLSSLLTTPHPQHAHRGSTSDISPMCYAARRGVQRPRARRGGTRRVDGCMRRM